MNCAGISTLALALGGVLVLGCGGGDRCEAVSERICEAACDCAAGDGCRIRSGTEATITHESPDDCLGFWVTFGCSSGGSEVNFGACNEALGDAECVDTGDGTALALPDDCGDPQSQRAAFEAWSGGE